MCCAPRDPSAQSSGKRGSERPGEDPENAQPLSPPAGPEGGGVRGQPESPSVPGTPRSEMRLSNGLGTGKVWRQAEIRRGGGTWQQEGGSNSHTGSLPPPPPPTTPLNAVAAGRSFARSTSGPSPHDPGAAGQGQGGAFQRGPGSRRRRERFRGQHLSGRRVLSGGPRTPDTSQLGERPARGARRWWRRPRPARRSSPPLQGAPRSSRLLGAVAVLSPRRARLGSSSPPSPSRVHSHPFAHLRRTLNGARRRRRQQRQQKQQRQQRQQRQSHGRGRTGLSRPARVTCL
ncbi:serine/arginine repetitive matrix protein 3-like [Sorex araneus]|uniref:serine/arginine repetitive matrix protein 3-like n=1 Tax=Sorex araneus TaxID=42254 RepID=UPI002433431A|nr:serine/arginine repetitive matrix protein 3-like [Sorex araneus]